LNIDYNDYLWENHWFQW